MDLTLTVNDTILNVRVVILVKTKNGIVLEKSPDGYMYFIGGRVKINETSEEAAKREVFEEVGIKAEKVTFRTVVENIFKLKEQQFHEICFVYSVDEEVTIPKLSKDRVEIPLEEFKNLDIRPKILKEYVESNSKDYHVVTKAE